jgi:multidrug efflux system outer membrane protein
MKRFLLLLPLALGGCFMAGPNYERPETDLPATYAEAGATGSAIAVPQQWWTLYGDATLDELVRVGLERNADARLASARVEEAEAALREAHATLFFPLVEYNADASRSRTLQFGTGNSFGLGVSTSFEIDLWGRLRRAERSVRNQLLASRYGRDTVALTLAASIARTYFAARSLDSQYVATQEILRAANESLSLARRRSEGGVGTGLDVSQAGAQQAAAAAQAKEIVRQRATIVHLLGTLTGRVALALPSQDLESLPIPPLPPAGLPSELLERRPDVRQAEAALASATELIGVARAAQFPKLELTGSLGVQSAELSELFAPGARVWSLGLGLVGPLIDSGRYAARTDQARARARQAEAGYQRAVETAFREVADALSNVRLAADSETDLRVRVEHARNALRLAQRRYESGYSAYLEVLDAQRTLNDAQLAFIRNRQAYLSYSVDLMNALGGGWAG